MWIFELGISGADMAELLDLEKRGLAVREHLHFRLRVSTASRGSRHLPGGDGKAPRNSGGGGVGALVLLRGAETNQFAILGTLVDFDVKSVVLERRPVREGATRAPRGMLPPGALAPRVFCDCYPAREENPLTRIGRGFGGFHGGLDAHCLWPHYNVAIEPSVEFFRAG